MIDQKVIAFLESKAYNLRLLSIRETSQAGSGHPTSCLSAADIVATLFFYAMRFDPHHFSNPDNDHFILSKGHAAPLLYAVWSELGMVNHHDLLSYRSSTSPLEGHPTRRFQFAEAATGSLGMGLSIGLGMALNAQREKGSSKVYVLLGDSEIAEGSVWEAVQLAMHYKTDNLIAIVDANNLGQSEETLYAHHNDALQHIFKAYGWETHLVNGHDITELCLLMDSLKDSYGKPIVIIAKTIKGYGVSAVEGKQGFHGKAFNKGEAPDVIKKLQDRFYAAAHYEGGYNWKPQLPAASELPHHPTIKAPVDKLYKQGDLESTRKAFGKALVTLGCQDPTVMVLDAEVKNSTYTELFQQTFPERFIQCFVAEQNMVSIGVGLDRCGKKPFMATFAAFLSRAHDQIRMAAIGNSTIKIMGSHAGVSIGQDGPSQMGLEDIALMRGLPESVVLYPCDAISAQKIVPCMAAYNKGIVYLRTTRMDTPIIYTENDEFKIGGLNMLRESDNALLCIVAAGITVHEALKAYEIAKAEGIPVAIVDLYCIKPLDIQRLTTIGHASSSRIITVEDHYESGGIGEAVSMALQDTGIVVHSLAVKRLPHSGNPEDLLAWAGIDADGIVKSIKNLIKRT